MLSPEQFREAVVRTRTRVEYRVSAPVVPQENSNDPTSTAHLAFMLQQADRLYRAGDVGQAGQQLGFVQGRFGVPGRGQPVRVETGLRARSL